ncbi:Sugar transferase involved in LPS biosynthesis (colanic, teichoic acid) [Clostridium cadaveris]|uniref:Sugar transferase involved in LPS biosynthesis (Colanic, teichoic acid) n=1 Tax=Clostridium cadaveris TaxID=1529 RepID=A0A1I2N765_9CLOT|nr:sugar transferase [Clostridium cadaveris]MDM8313016.1 sugar transferase [Clostridium cadaveris]SFF98930.1 Sugar transferase involved in LPS biosynthesis (colanic, teichoic acid) [Clostridium cadaveris]
MILKQWDYLPDNMKNESVKKYYDMLDKKRGSLYFKRIFDILAAIIILIILSPIFVVLSIAIKLDSKGPIMFRQVRVTQYGRTFRIFKFRTMVNNAEKIGTQVTTKNDVRVTKVGSILRKCRLDELPQLLNIISGDMSFVGTRPEVPKYVDRYTEEMLATLLLPAGITSEASIEYKDEDSVLSDAENVDDTYVDKVLPGKMKYNLESIKRFSLFGEIKTMLKTLGVVIHRDINRNEMTVENNRGVGM